MPENIQTVGAMCDGPRFCPLAYRSPPVTEEGRIPVMLEGEIGQEMYIVVEGSRVVQLEKAGNDIGKLSAGDYFGELGA